MLGYSVLQSTTFELEYGRMVDFSRITEDFLLRWEAAGH